MYRKALAAYFEIPNRKGFDAAELTEQGAKERGVISAVGVFDTENFFMLNPFGNYTPFG